jgi:hypothetical protein
MERHERATPAAGRDGFAQLWREIEPAREAVAQHVVYGRLTDVYALRTFMSNHVFAVWDFMSLLKLLQQRLTCVEVPWLPPLDTTAARLINEIVLNEETDEIAPGRYSGHFHLYLAAMQEVDADSRPIRDFVAALRQRVPPEEALAGVPIAPSTRRFVLRNLALVNRPTHEVAAAFLLGREDLVPTMFTRILAHLTEKELRCDSFRLYLERHVALDAGQHGPMARRLLAGICGADARRWKEATQAANAALEARQSLWDGILEVLGG